jgi:hypothetical protein
VISFFARESFAVTRHLQRSCDLVVFRVLKKPAAVSMASPVRR